MDIKTYLRSSDPKITMTQFAENIGVNLSTLHDYSTGRRSVPLSVAIAIERATGGMVAPVDLLETREGYLNRENAAA